MILREIINRDIAYIYGLRFDRKTNEFSVEIRTDVYEYLEKLNTSNHAVLSFFKAFGFGSFNQNRTDSKYGFDGCFSKRESDRAGFLILSTAIPILEKEASEECQFCNGEGVRCDSKCLFCNGVGKESITDLLPAYKISASFNLLFISASMLKEIKVDEKEYQAVHMELSTYRDENGGDINAWYSQVLVRWLKSLDEEEFYQKVAPKLIENMAKVYSIMFPLSGLSILDFRVILNDNGHLHIDCPGNACGLDPAVTWNKGDGYEVMGHNIDNSAKQLQLLVGLATLTELYYEAHK